MSKGDVDAEGDLAAFFVAQEPGLRRYFAKCLRTIDECDDLTQEAWLRLSRNADRAAGAPGPYLRRIAASLVHDFLRKRRRTPPRADLSAGSEVVDRRAVPEEIAMWRSEISALRQALNEMPKRRRDIFVLVSLRGEDRRAVARRYGVSKRTVEAELRMALDHCADRLGPRVPP
ncbi:MAG: sigma-70 family RNA polymerase sigma factor [Pseudomonadota bacterium]